MNAKKTNDPEFEAGLNINITGSDYNENDFLFCWDKFKNRPNRIVIHNNYSTAQFIEIIEKQTTEKNTLTEAIPDGERLSITDKILAKVDKDCYLSYIVVERDTDMSFVETITIYYNNGYAGVEKLIDELSTAVVKYDDEYSNILNTIAISPLGLEIEPLASTEADPDIDLYYSTETFKELAKATKKIKKSDRGLTILYGERGTGKTSAINYIASKLDRIIIYIPNNMIDHTINNPEFRKFVKKFERPILAIDDCETLFGEFLNKSNLSNNLLQMVDGLLADQINVNIVAIFNIESEDDIDDSLLECNNLIGVVEFEKLSAKESNDLAKSLESNKKYKGKTKLVDIIKRRDSKEYIEIGF